MSKISTVSLRVIAVLFVAALLSACSDKRDVVDSYLGFDISQDIIDTHLQDQMEVLDIAGMSIAIINDGTVVYHRTFGYADLAEKRPVTETTIFEGASISKSLFAFFAMTFVEEGRLDLDRPLFEYYPHPDIQDDERYKKITTRMVLCHRSGLPNWREDEDDKRLKTKFEPNTDYLYSGEGYQYLANVLMHITGTDHQGLERLFQKRIGEPIGLEHTVFIQNEYTRSHKAEPYDEDGQWIDWHQDYWFQKEDGKFYAPSSVHSEAQDFSKWMIAVMDQEILSDDSYAELLTPQTEVPFDGADVSYTLGFLTPNVPFTSIYLHSGNNEGFTSWYTLDTKKDWGFVLFTNSEHGDQLGQELLFYLMTGPDLTKLYIILGAAVLLIGFGLFYGVRFLIRKIKNNRTNGLDPTLS